MTLYREKECCNACTVWLCSPLFTLLPQTYVLFAKGMTGPQPKGFCNAFVVFTSSSATCKIKRKQIVPKVKKNILICIISKGLFFMLLVLSFGNPSAFTMSICQVRTMNASVSLKTYNLATQRWIFLPKHLKKRTSLRHMSQTGWCTGWNTRLSSKKTRKWRDFDWRNSVFVIITPCIASNPSHSSAEDDVGVWMPVNVISLGNVPKLKYIGGKYFVTLKQIWLIFCNHVFCKHVTNK